MSSLNDVCFEQIRDTFYYGMVGEFKLVVDKKTGSFNATKLCADGGKEFRKWARLEKSKNLMEYYKVADQIRSATFYEVKGGNSNDTTGQYVRKELILDIASWISVEFYDKCNRIVGDFYVAEYKQQMKDFIKQKDDQLDELMAIVKSADEWNKRLGIKLDVVLALIVDLGLPSLSSVSYQIW
jgi:hypothetical protein